MNASRLFANLPNLTTYQGSAESTLSETDGGGFIFIDRPDANGPVHSWMALIPETIDKKPGVRISQLGFDSTDAFRRQLHFLASQRDQFGSVTMRLPTDLPLNWILREAQIAHRPVNHPVATVVPQTRMQIRVLDHAKLLQNLRILNSRPAAAIAPRSP